jgi:integrase/recombinase XerD
MRAPVCGTACCGLCCGIRARVGEALGLRHEDLAAAEGELTITPRVNDNGARVKSARPRTIPLSPEVIRLYADYLHEEYGDLDSDYVLSGCLIWGCGATVREG